MEQVKTESVNHSSDTPFPRFLGMNSTKLARMSNEVAEISTASPKKR